MIQPQLLIFWVIINCRIVFVLSELLFSAIKYIQIWVSFKVIFLSVLFPDHRLTVHVLINDSLWLIRIAHDQVLVQIFRKYVDSQKCWVQGYWFLKNQLSIVCIWFKYIDHFRISQSHVHFFVEDSQIFILLGVRRSKVFCFSFRAIVHQLLSCLHIYGVQGWHLLIKIVDGLTGRDRHSKVYDISAIPVKIFGFLFDYSLQRVDFEGDNFLISHVNDVALLVLRVEPE